MLASKYLGLFLHTQSVRILVKFLNPAHILCIIPYVWNQAWWKGNNYKYVFEIVIKCLYKKKVREALWKSYCQPNAKWTGPFSWSNKYQNTNDTNDKLSNRNKLWVLSALSNFFATKPLSHPLITNVSSCFKKKYLTNITLVTFDQE